ncbi:MAG: macro domain-containing protein [Xenococcaceae cyanobacterium]
MFKFLENQKYPVILIVFGCLLAIISFFEVSDITKLQISRSAEPIYSLYVLGLILILISIFLYFSDENAPKQFLGKAPLGWLKTGSIRNLKNGFSSVITDSVINVIFGIIESIEREPERSLVVLPANEFFDDECINDKRSSLGAFIQAEYPNQIDNIKNLINKDLEKIPSQEVEKETGVVQLSYGIGTGIYLDQPLSSKNRILFLSVTTKRAGEGLRAEMSYIFKAVNEIQRIVADKRLRSVYVPLIGSGHGGLRKEVALFGMLLAVCGVLTRPSGRSIKEFNIVVFQANENHQPSVSPNSAKRLLGITTGMFS